MAIRRNRNKHQDDTLLDLSQARTSANNFFEENQTKIIGIVAGIVIIFGGWFAYKNLIQKPKEEKALAQMWKAQSQFEQDSFLVALENPGGGYSGFLSIIKDYKGTKAGNLSNFYAGLSYLNLGNFDAALTHLNNFKPTDKIGPTLKYGALGDVYSELNQMDKAMDNYKKASSASKNDLLTPYYLKKLALLHETQSQIDEAVVLYKEIKSKYPNSNEALTIDKYIARAEAK